MALDIVVVGTEKRPVYQHIALKALHMNELGLSKTKIARCLGVTDKTAARAIQWIQKG